MKQIDIEQVKQLGSTLQTLNSAIDANDNSIIELNTMIGTQSNAIINLNNSVIDIENEIIELNTIIGEKQNILIAGNGIIIDENNVISATGGNSNLIFTNVSASNWVSDSTYSDYGYKCDISCSGVTSSMVATVMFAQAEAESGNYATVCETGNEIVTIYSSVNTSITIPTIVVMGA